MVVMVVVVVVVVAGLLAYANAHVRKETEMATLYANASIFLRLPSNRVSDETRVSCITVTRWRWEAIRVGREEKNKRSKRSKRKSNSS